jgi:hypothetical protein
MVNRKPALTLNLIKRNNMHLIDKDPVPKGYKASSTPASEPKKDSLGTALRKKMSAPLTKALRHFPKKHEDYKMEQSNDDYKILKTYNDYKKSGRPFVESKPNAQGATGDQRMVAEFHRVKDKLSK